MHHVVLVACLLETRGVFQLCLVSVIVYFSILSRGEPNLIRRTKQIETFDSIRASGVGQVPLSKGQESAYSSSPRVIPRRTDDHYDSIDRTTDLNVLADQIRSKMYDYVSGRILPRQHGALI